MVWHLRMLQQVGVWLNAQYVFCKIILHEIMITKSYLQLSEWNEESHPGRLVFFLDLASWY